MWGLDCISLESVFGGSLPVLNSYNNKVFKRFSLFDKNLLLHNSVGHVCTVKFFISIRIDMHWEQLQILDKVLVCHPEYNDLRRVMTCLIKLKPFN